MGRKPIPRPSDGLRSGRAMRADLPPFVAARSDGAGSLGVARRPSRNCMSGGSRRCRYTIKNLFPTFRPTKYHNIITRRRLCFFRLAGKEFFCLIRGAHLQTDRRTSKPKTYSSSSNPRQPLSPSLPARGHADLLKRAPACGPQGQSRRNLSVSAERCSPCSSPRPPFLLLRILRIHSHDITWTR